MSLCHVHWYSRALDKQVAMEVLLPDGGKPPFATYYLLHGLSDDHTIWLRRTRIEIYNDLPLIIVMPDGYRGFYTNNEEGPRYATYMAEELPAFIERNFPAKRSRDGRCIGGLSMGGYGALRLALGYPHMFASVNSHSGGVMHGTSRLYDKKEQAEQRGIFGTNPQGSGHDLIHLAKLAKKSNKLPKMLIDCGLGDFLIQDNRAFHKLLQKLKIPHQYAEFPGVHNWDYWDIHVREALAFHAKNLKLKRL